MLPHRLLLTCTLFLSPLTLSHSTSAAVVTRSVLKSYFQAGDKPTAQQFTTFIDSIPSLADLSLVGLSVYDPSAPYPPGTAQRFNIGDTTPTSPLAYADPRKVDLASDFAGHSGFASLLLQDLAGQTHFGFLQLQMDPPSTDPTGTPIPPAIFIEYLAFDDSPSTPLTIFAVPEPMALTFVTPLLFLRPRKLPRSILPIA